MRMVMRKFYVVFTMIMLLCLVGCKQSDEVAEDTKDVTLYYLNGAGDKLLNTTYTLEIKDKVEMIDDVIVFLKDKNGEYDVRPILDESLDLKRIILKESTATLYFDASYGKLGPSQEILVRAGIVKSITQVPGIEFVSIRVGNSPLTDTDGNIVGNMTAKMFIDSAQTDFDEHEKVKLLLYFGNAEKTELASVSKDVVYNSNITVEKLVVEQLIAGPSNDHFYATVNPSTKIVNITTKDGVCYVNLDEAFLTGVDQINAELTIYSIVNSLVELPNVNKVQFMINGDSNYTYKEQIDLSQMLDRNLEIVE